MSKSKIAQIPMDPDEYDRLRKIAEVEGDSVAEMVRQAVRDRYFTPAKTDSRKQALANFLSLPPIEIPDWPDLKKELENRHDDSLLP